MMVLVVGLGLWPAGLDGRVKPGHDGVAALARRYGVDAILSVAMAGPDPAIQPDDPNAPTFRG